MNATERARRSDALYRDDAKMHRRDLCDMVAQREAEIEKLRELIAEAHSCKTNDGCCEDCYCDEGCCPVEQRMQELGIKVDG